jgi:bacillolysin
VLPDISLVTESGVDADEARQAALEKIARDYDVEAGDLKAADPELWIYDPTLLGGPGIQVPRLVWRTEVTPAEGLVDIRELVLVDAQIGAVVLNFNQIHTAKNRNTHDANNTTTLPGHLVCNEANPCTNPSYDADVRAAHLYAGHVYDFYSTNHGRDSLDNAGMTLISTADYCDPDQPCPMQNAFWNGTQMAYGDGYASADDAVGHELTHGVTDFESNLFYYYQSGAINESLSDVWGEFIDQTNGSGTDTAAVKWKIGEDVPGGTLRDMRDPTLFDDPDRMTSSLYYNVDDHKPPREWDRGGVHHNSGVNNKAAYLLTDGDTFNGKTVTGLGITKVAKIYYEVQTNLLTSASDYQDLYSTLQQACASLVGTSGLTAADCQEVKDAVDATEMNVIPPKAPNPEAPICAAGQLPTDLFSDDLENPASGNWATRGTGWYYPQNTHPYTGFDATYATSGTTNFWGVNRNSVGDYSIARTAGVTPPIGKITYLRFNHSYQFDDDPSGAYDGGVLEYSTNNGATWLDAGSLITDNKYNGAISSPSNPLNGRGAFVRESNGYISSRVNLSSLVGQSVRFRFRIGTDNEVDDFGWFVDDVRVYTCGVGGGGQNKTWRFTTR